jgi:D-sedoheptulose 7-phosphate isomerase
VPAAAAIDERVACGERFFAAEHERLARLCRRMAERFGRGGRLLAFGRTQADASDVRHVAVEFVHPVIVGKRALPALGVPCADAGLLAGPDDIAMAFGAGHEVSAAVRAVRAAGCLTVAFAETGAEEELLVPAEDPLIAQELVETAYHVLWELVHVFFEHAGRASRQGGASSFLYPFLDRAEADEDAVLADVASSVVAKGREAAALRAATLSENADALAAAARSLGACLAAGGKVLALGNGGSATDAMDAVADLRRPPAPLRPRPAIDLSEDAAILTAVANDIGVASMFARQVIAYGRPGDALLAFSTSGGSENVLAALGQARRGGLQTVAFVGYGGGRIAAEGLADHVVVTRSEHIPRIQEAQASAWHVLRRAVG